ncbi:hypothetical protein PPERSA_01067 [Pseudocohnilembus persalinus]|uniref:SAM-dependent methyltransferase RsmB-F/NOP2-type catalytic core domain-containing protein n=1 Tax=Pseudocohnilembus persalinus TaxID=266149 RepID=A0A0V0QVT3_PSEPJ|nr:hypothetical protein PPERSA_01067 [Pseudocohnilembus persalinus]|eukprot:KRX05989.1 hypothetical protein PPERSA_01067 [Pseudocohnilembus persalinus]
MEINKSQKQNNLLELLPQSFEQFLEQNKINKDIFKDIEYLKSLPRYFRLKPEFREKNQQEVIKIIAEQLKCNTSDIKKVEWIDDMYELTGSIKIASCQFYQQGQLYGIDLASATCVMALELQKNNSVLDLCCAPATKLSYIADILRYQQSDINYLNSKQKGYVNIQCNLQNQVQQQDDQNDVKEGQLEVENQKQKLIVGVDISHNRLSVSKNIVNKYQLGEYIELVEQDGTKYNSERLFDRVLVDAECTHDGSVKHLLKFINEQSGNQNQQDIKSKNQKKDILQEKQELEKNIQEQK